MVGALSDRRWYLGAFQCTEPRTHNEIHQFFTSEEKHAFLQSYGSMVTRRLHAIGAVLETFVSGLPRDVTWIGTNHAPSCRNKLIWGNSERQNMQRFLFQGHKHLQQKHFHWLSKTKPSGECIADRQKDTFFWSLFFVLQDPEMLRDFGWKYFNTNAGVSILWKCLCLRMWLFRNNTHTHTHTRAVEKDGWWENDCITWKMGEKKKQRFNCTKEKETRPRALYSLFQFFPAEIRFELLCLSSGFDPRSIQKC